jgi:hypothetical protein
MILFAKNLRTTFPVLWSGHHGRALEDRMERGKEHLTDLVDMHDPQAIFEEVMSVVFVMRPGFDETLLRQTRRDIVRLFNGEYPGYRKCNTAYHDERHTMLVLLAMVRLMDGSIVENRQISEKGINIGLVSALMHDTGYIQLNDDREGTGAKYTLVHIPRSIEFVRQYFAENEYLKDDMVPFRDILNCTGVSVKVNEVTFTSPEEELLGKMLGTADLLGQMADRLYLEKLFFLFHEFDEAHVKGFDNEVDLFQKTMDFYDSTKKRFRVDLGGVDQYMLSYFKERLNIDRDLYKESIEKNISYLRLIMENHRDDYSRYLRRRVGTIRPV